MRQFPRNLLIAAGVVLFHFAALRALQPGLVRRTAEVIVPVAFLSERIEPPAPAIDPPRPPPKPPPEPANTPAARKTGRTLPPSPQSTTEPVPAPVPNAAPGVPAAQPLPAPMAAPSTRESVPPPAAPKAPAKVELPSSDASYLQNPTPVYPPISKRLGEQGRVVVRVLIGADGVPQQAELKHSSGFERLDRSALEYVMKCRYVPGQVGGVPRAMWYEAPVSFVLE